MTQEACMERLISMYDGYHINYRDKAGIFNPFSILNVLDSRLFENYWFASGTPTFLAEILKKTQYDLREQDGLEVSSTSLTERTASLQIRLPKQ